MKSKKPDVFRKQTEQAPKQANTKKPPTEKISRKLSEQNYALRTMKSSLHCVPLQIQRNDQGCQRTNYNVKEIRFVEAHMYVSKDVICGNGG